ncbi:tetratricopeptide repeat protein [Paracoccus pacificus]|uniref:Tetratricopeptide repeat protein n=1 Tax=Paracoccus pacificus TaxID=1463598 RepID=A0ABW4RA65_9RHOB
MTEAPPAQDPQSDGATTDALTPDQAEPAQPLAKADMDKLFAELADPNNDNWKRAESDILREWSKSGSPAMDLLMKKGEAALDEGDVPRAIGELTALTDHAPDFASGWQLRASAFFLDGDFGPAAADLARALQLEPRQFAALTQLGVMLEEMGRDQQALDAFKASLKIHPHQQEAIDGAARLEKKLQGLTL